MRDSVLVTGVTGFIGSHVAEQLTGSGYTVGGLVRKSSNTGNIDCLDIRIEYGSLEDIESLESIVSRYDSVIHIAGYASDWGEFDTFYKTNVIGTVNILKAIKKAGHKHVILTGSISTYGEENHIGEKDESYPDTSHYPYFLDHFFPCKMNYYRDTKADAKQKAIAFAKENDLNLTIIEPTWVYGEREFSSGFYEYIKSVQSGMFVMPGNRKNRFHMIYVKDLARAYQLALEKQPKGIHPIIIGNESAPLMNDVYTRFCNEARLKVPIKLPKWIFYPLGFGIEFIYTLLKIETAPVLTRGRVNMFYDNIAYKVEKAEGILGFKSKTTLEEGIQKTVQWYFQNGYL
jgi:nucleoside-diphosphate-sugar epimerase